MYGLLFTIILTSNLFYNFCIFHVAKASSGGHEAIPRYAGGVFFSDRSGNCLAVFDMAWKKKQ